jgi:hypothetical protein
MKTTLATLLLVGFVTLAGAQAQKSGGEKFYGKITAIDTAGKSLSVHNKTRNADATFAWTDKTEFISSKQPISASQLKAGDFLVVSFRDVSGIKEAQKVVLRANFGKKKGSE